MARPYIDIGYERKFSRMTKQNMNALMSRLVSADVMLAVLAIASVALLTFEIIAESGVINKAYVYVVDAIISGVFLSHWISRYRKAESKSQFVRDNWWELIASIPAYIEPTGVLRFVRLVVRLRILFNTSRHLVKHAYSLEIFTLFGSIMFGAADMFHSFEYGINENVHSFFDSVWWAMVTISTVGYGDISPVTMGGRIVSMALMMLGIGLLGLTTAHVAKHLVKNQR